MGHGIVHCGGCGTQIRETDFSAGKAHSSDNRAWCRRCRAAPEPSPSKPAKAVTPRPFPAVPARPPRRSALILACAGTALLGVLALLAVLLSGPGKNSPPAHAAPQVAPSPERGRANAPRLDEANLSELPPPPVEAVVKPAAPKAPEMPALAEPDPAPESANLPPTAKALDEAGAETLSRPTSIPVVPAPVAGETPAVPSAPAKSPEASPDKVPEKSPVRPAALKPVKVDLFQLKVDETIRKGTEFLKAGYVHPQCKELVLLTLLHAEVPETDPKFKQVLREALEFNEDDYSARTYPMSLLAVALEELDRVKYQKEIAKCAQFLVDNQARNGQWNYGSPTKYPEEFPTAAPKSVATASKTKSPPAANERPLRVKPPVKVQLRVKSQRAGPDHGDNSNSQYAALGLRACHDSGIILPKETVERAWKWWVESQEPAGGAKSSKKGATGGGVMRPRGWNYLSDGRVPDAENYSSQGSMTAGAVGALCIYDHILGIDWKRDPAVRDGIFWMVQNFTVTSNPKGSAEWHFYYLYAVERVGMLYPTVRLGTHDWYLEGAKFLVEAQEPDGSWNRSTYHNGKSAVLDTCFAILFLKRVTRPLQDVATVDRFNKK